MKTIKWSIIQVQPYDMGNYVFLVYQDRTGTVWNPQYYVWGLGDVASVSLGNDPYFAETSLIWSLNNTIYQASRTNNGAWQTSTLGTGSDPQTAYIGSWSDYTWSDLGCYLYGQSGSPLWSLQIPSQGLNKSMIANAEGLNKSATLKAHGNVHSITNGTPVSAMYSRMVTITDTIKRMQISIGISQPRLGNKYLSFNTINDTFPNINAANFLQCISTQQTVVSDDDDTLSFVVTIRSKNLKTNLPSVRVSQMIDKSVIEISTFAPLSQNDERGYGIQKVRIPIKNMKGRSLGVQLSGFDVSALGNKFQFSLEHFYKIESSDLVALQKKSEAATTQMTQTTTVTLGSYPNPFNPTTNIGYQLIENSRVSIKVYDILGRQILTLVDGNKTAGQYTAVFDGSHFASGVYFVRMMVQGSNAQQLVKILKIQMLK